MSENKIKQKKARAKYVLKYIRQALKRNHIKIENDIFVHYYKNKCECGRHNIKRFMNCSMEDVVNNFCDIIVKDGEMYRDKYISGYEAMNALKTIMAKHLKRLEENKE
jgi:phage pi2 protein 07